MYEYTYDGRIYSLIYVLTGEAFEIGPTVAFAFSYDCSAGGVLHKHGSPENVNAWAIAQRRMLMEASKDFKLIKGLNCKGIHTTPADYERMANEITVVEGVFPIDEIMKCIEISGYIGTFYKKLQEGQICDGRTGESPKVQMMSIKA